MSRWDEQFQKHAIHATLKDASDLIGTEFDDTSSEAQSEKRRILKVISTYQDTLSQLDPELVAYNVLDDLNSEIRNQNIWDELTKYSSEGNHQNLKNANDHITKHLSQLSLLLAIAKKSAPVKPIKGLEKSLDTFVKAIDAKKEVLEKDLKKIASTVENQKEKIEELSNNVSTKKQETDNLITSWQEQHSNAQHKRETNFVADQKVRTDTYAEWQKETETKTKSSVDGLIDKSSEKLEKSQRSFDEKISAHIATAEEKHAAILKLYELVAWDSVAGGYKKNADDEKRTANFLRWGAVVFIILTALWAVFSYVTGNSTVADGSLLIIGLIRAFSVTGILLFGAVYLAKQSNEHRCNEKRARRFALEVNAIDPFIASLNEDDKKALKYKLSDKLFGQQEIEKDTENKVIAELPVSVLVKGILDMAK